MNRILTALIFSVFFLTTAFSQKSPCTQQEVFRQLDFWIGNWRVETPDGELAGHNKIEVILDSCIIFENWTGAGFSRGKSFNYYNTATKKWHQKWVDNFANPLEFEGEVINDKIVYTGTSHSRTGEVVFNEMTLTKISDDEVHQLWRQAKAGGDWQTVFDGRYLREK